MLFNSDTSGSTTKGIANGEKTGAASQLLPPLPDLKTSPDGGSGAPTDPFQATMMQIKPVHDAVNTINMAIQQIAQTGMIPGGGPLDQIVQLTNSLLPLAAQAMLKPGGMPPPSAAPPDLGAGSGGVVTPGPAPSGQPQSSSMGPGV